MATIKSSTQAHLDIVDIKANTVVLKNSSAAQVIETSAINFDLLSLMEQDAAISAYSSLINSLTFPIQVTIRAKRMDISEYLERIRNQEIKQTNDKIKNQIKAYRKFIEEDLITKEEVLDKKFYVTIPYGKFTLSKANPFDFLTNLITPSAKETTKLNIDKILKEAVADLNPKTEFLIKEFSRIGIKSRQLTTHELIKLYYEFYNSEVVEAQKVKGNMADYTSALVEPKIV